MQKATLAELIAAPVGRWAQTPELVVWVATPRLVGIAYTGFISDVALLRELASLPKHPAFARPYRAIVDGGGISGLDPAVFALLVEHVHDLAGTQGLLERVAVVRPAGLVGAATVGLFHEHLARRLQLAFVDDFAAAIAHVEAEVHRDELLEVHEASRGASLVSAARGVLRADPRQSLAAVAAKLATSTRTLQRAFGAAGSSFRDEVAQARFAFADALLRTTADKIDVIARRAGYASATSFTRRFAQTYGRTPNEVRRQRTK